jgi:hypothetical protein
MQATEQRRPLSCIPSQARRELPEAGLMSSSIPTLLVEGDDKPGPGFAIAGVNLTFFVAQAMGREFSAVLGFETEADAKTAAPLIKKATAGKKK